MVKNKKENISDKISRVLAELNYKNSKKILREKRKVGIKKTPNKNFSKKSEISINIGIIKNLWKTLIESSIKKDKKADNKDENETDVEENDEVTGGYGTVSKSNGYFINPKYANYSKIWGSLGNFRSKNMYENAESPTEFFSNIQNESSREMVSTETIEKAAKHFKYFVLGDVIGDIGLVPPVGLNINSKDWEKYRLMSMMSIYQPIIAMKRSSA